MAANMTAGATFRATIAAAVLAAAFALPRGGDMSEQPYQPDRRLSVPLFAAVAIPHDAQKYDTVGDWHFSGAGVAASTHVTVSTLPSREHEILVAVHELIEAELCRKAGITPEQVTAFDEGFEKRRQETIARLERELGRAVAGQHTRKSVALLKAELRDAKENEPGDDPEAPYHAQHQFATKIERQLATALGVDWKAYEAEISALEWRKPDHE
jgi:hypothetical protein